MAIKQIMVSDISGDEIPEGQHVTIVVTQHPELTSPRELDLTVDELAGLVDTAVLMDAARVGSDAFAKPSRTRRRTSGTSTARIDYTSPEWAGVIHRGRVTEAEAEWVRENLKAANANRKREGQPEIDPEDPAEIKRYFR